MRICFTALWLMAATVAAWGASESKPVATQPYEITKDHYDIEVMADGSSIRSREESYRVLNAVGIDLLHERKFAFTQGFEDLQIVAAYTLKANGQRIAVPRDSYLSGYGQSSQHGFQDNHVVSVFFPNLEVGDSVVLVTLHRQLVPWFAGRFDMRADFGRTVAAHDVRYAITAPATMPIKIDAVGLEGGVPETLAGKNRWVWQYHNDTPVAPESDAVAEADFMPHLGVTSFADYADVAHAYYERSHSTTAVTPAIAAMANQLTAGIADKREQAKTLYDWVSTHIAYVEIQLGAGGFTPHAANDVLAKRFGDCKDHVVLLEALLKAKDIDSTSVLIKAGTLSFKLPDAASPHAFDHVITYLPAFDLYLDSTARLAPFGTLPYQDAGKPVVRVSDGTVAHTPTPNSTNSTVLAATDVTLLPDGSAEGHTRISATGAYGINVRGLMQAIPAGKEDQFFRRVLGPGAEGTLDRGDPLNLSEPYVATADYRIPNAIAFPGPGALPYSLSFRPFYFTELVAGNLPASRNTDYVCLSLSAVEQLKVTLPPGVRLISIPDPQSIKADGVRLQTDFDRTDARTLAMKFTVKIDHPEESCTPEYYARVHAALAKMTNLLRQQVIYRGPRENEK